MSKDKAKYIMIHITMTVLTGWPLTRQHKFLTTLSVTATATDELFTSNSRQQTATKIMSHVPLNSSLWFNYW